MTTSIKTDATLPQRLFEVTIENIINGLQSGNDERVRHNIQRANQLLKQYDRSDFKKQNTQQIKQHQIAKYHSVSDKK